MNPSYIVHCTVAVPSTEDVKKKNPTHPDLHTIVTIRQTDTEQQGAAPHLNMLFIFCV